MEFYEKLRCVECHSTRLRISSKLKQTTIDAVRCLQCGREYYSVDGVLNMLPNVVLERDNYQNLELEFKNELEAKRNEIDYYSNHIDPLPEDYQDVSYGLSWNLKPPQRSNDMHNWFFNRTRRYISDAMTNADVLKVGCGVGLASEYFAKQYNSKMTGLDIADCAVHAAVKRSEIWGYSDLFCGIVGDMENLPFRDNTFEVGISESSIHHSFNPYKAIEELIRISSKFAIIYHEAVNSLIIKVALLLGLTDEYETEASGNKVFRFDKSELYDFLKENGAKNIIVHQNWCNTSNLIRFGKIMRKSIRPISKYLESEFVLNLQDLIFGRFGNSILAVVTL